ncbi:Major Facilitator Superfamily protein [Amycolatopsis marina]|uniref:Major Facilitator Superfamily protein n=1 Tax=Amycolatopsis marina TaxID=490629 RepID=A0A1I1B1K2_9PSEU|nr:MFS transporter [Amycolatopsis marina]SFB44219.1 Major Facilitator Superfamily protein [Amycolatopsis marina]
MTGVGARRATGPVRPPAVLTVVVLVAFVTTLDNTIVVSAAPSIGRELGMSLSALQWVSIAYMLPYAGLLLLSGAVLDRMGMRALLAGFVVFAAGALLGGVSRNPELLIVARVVQGIAAAFIVPGTLSLLRTSLPQRLRAAGAAAWTAALAAALAVGPWLGGALAEYVHWSWIFFSNLPFVLVAAVLILPAMGERGARSTAPVRFGAALTATCGLVLLTAAFVGAGPSDGGTGTAVGLAVAGVLVLLAFAAVEQRSDRPLVPGRLLTNRVFTGANTVLLLWGLGISGIVFFTPLLHQDFLGMSPAEAGLPLVLVAAAVICATPFVPAANRNWGPHRTVFAGLGTVALGLLALAAVNDIHAIETRVLGFVLIGAGSAFTTPLTAHALDLIEDRDAGVASGVLTASRELSSALGVAVIGLVVTTVRARELAGGAPAGSALAGGYTAGLLTAAVLQACGAVLALRVLAPKRELARKNAETSEVSEVEET